MKLHLPIALLAAVICSMAFVQAEDVTAKTSGTVSDASGSYKYETAGNGEVTANVSGDVTKLNFGGTNMTGIAANLPFEYKDSEGKRNAASTKLNIGDGITATKVDGVVGAGVLGCFSSGNKETNINKNAVVQIAIAGYYYWNYKKTASDVFYELVKANSPVNDGATITLNIYGTTGDVLGHYISTQSITDNPTWTSKEALEINVKGGTTGVIHAGGYNSFVDNTVKVTVSEGSLTKDIYGGAQSYNATKNAYVKSTHIEINGGTVEGSVSGGGSFNVNGAQYGYYSEVKEDTQIEIKGGTIAGNVQGGGVKDTVHGKTQISLSGGVVKESVYGAGNGGKVENGTNITISGAGTEVGGTIYGGGTNGATVTGDRKLTVTEDHDSTSREEGYKLADFTDVNVDGDIKVESLEGAKDDKGAKVTEVTVGEEGSISTKAGGLSNLKSLKVKGALTIDMSDAAANESGVTGDDLSLDGATINVVATGAGASDSISVFAFGTSNEDAGNFTLTLNGSAVDEELWGFENGELFIKEASTTTLNLNRNQSRFHDALCAMQEDGKATPELAALATSRDADEVKAGLDALSGHEYATAMSSQIEGNLGHLRRLKGAMGKGDMLGREAKTGAAGDRWRAGVSVFHEETELDSDARGDGYDRSETGAMLTAEYFMRENLTVGGALSYGRTRLSPDGARSRHEDNTRLDVYALYGKKRWSFATSLGLGIHEHELPGGDADGYSVNFMQDAACTLLHREKDNVQVFGTVESSWNNIDSFSGGMVSGGSQDAWATDVTVGLRYNRALRPIGFAPAGVFTVQTGVTASIGDIKSGVDMSINGYGYRQESATRNRWGWSIGAGVDVPLRHNVSVFGVVDAVMRGDSSSVDGQIGVKVSF